MKSCLRKGKFSVSSGFLLTVAALIYLDGYELILRCLFACLMHETGHWIAILLLGGRVRAVRLSAVGAEMSYDGKISMSYKWEIAIALAGPAVSLTIAVIAKQLGWFLFAGMNLSLGLLNLIPVMPLDGGRILGHILYAVCPEKAEKITQGISTVFAGLALGLGAAAWRRWGNITLLSAALWLLYEVIK